MKLFLYKQNISTISVITPNAKVQFPFFTIIGTNRKKNSKNISYTISTIALQISNIHI